MRKQKAKNRWIKECGLKYVYEHMNRIVYRPPPYTQSYRLGGINDERKKIILAYENIIAGNRGSLDWLLKTYIKDRQVDRGPIKALSPRTLVDYENYTRVLLSKKWFGRGGNPNLNQIKRLTIRSYLDNYPSYTQARLHIQLIRAAWNWGLERYELPVNPCAGIKMPPPASRKQFWSDKQYRTALKVASEMRTPYMYAVMELQYLQGARFGEVQGIRISDCGDDGIHLKRSKGSKDEITEWTPRLRAVYDLCRSMHASAPTPIDGGYLLHNKDGSQITNSQYKNSCKRIKVRCKALGVDIDDLHFHDIKANAAMDRSDNDVGHMTEAMRRRYADRAAKPKARKATK